MAVAGWILPAVNPSANVLGFLTSCCDGPVPPGTNPITALRPIELIGEQEGPGPLGMRLGWSEDLDGEALKLRVPEKALPTLGRLKGLDQALGQSLGHGKIFLSSDSAV
jgi:hypothetical protein